MTETTLGASNELLVELTAEIVAAYVSNHVVPVAELPTLIADVHSALNNTTAPTPVVVPVEKPKPAVSVRKSVQDDQITCLECGGTFKSLKRHLMTDHGMTPEQYRAKWGLQRDYPMIAPGYAAKRRELAVKIGLGRKQEKAEPAAPKRKSGGKAATKPRTKKSAA